MNQAQHTSPTAISYARSILQLATEQNQADQVGQDLADLSKVIQSDPAFETFLANPAVGETQRQAVFEKVFRGRVSPLVFNFLGVLNRKNRLHLLSQITTAFAQMLDEQKGIIEVDVTVAQRLSPEQLEQVRQKVGQALKREVVVHQYVDGSVIGGIVLRIEDRLLDASVRAQLRAIRRQLLASRPG